LKSQWSSFSTERQLSLSSRRLELTLGDTPEVLSAFDCSTVGSGDVVGTSNDGERHDIVQSSCVLSSSRLFGVDRWAVDLDILSSNHFSDLYVSTVLHGIGVTRTMYLKLCRSSWVMVSALAITGIKLTLVPSLFIISTSRGLTLIISYCDVKEELAYVDPGLIK
jgi:hypothetical protein